MKNPLYKVIAGRIDAYKRCVAQEKHEWAERHEQAIFEINKRHLPHGAGFDGDTFVDFDQSTSEKLVIHTEFHHMSEHGYDGWTEHKIIVKASLIHGLDIRVTGRDRNGIKEYIYDAFVNALSENVEY